MFSGWHVGLPQRKRQKLVIHAFEETAAKLVDDLEPDADDLVRQPCMPHRIPVHPVHPVRQFSCFLGVLGGLARGNVFSVRPQILRTSPKVDRNRGSRPTALSKRFDRAPRDRLQHAGKIRRYNAPRYSSRAAPNPDEIMLLLEKIALRRGRHLLLEQADLRIHPGHRLGLVGRNGSGKSSLFALIRGELDSDEGRIEMPPDTRIAHLAQESPAGERAAIEYVIDGDTELRELETRIAGLERAGEHEGLHELHERMVAIDGYAAEARAARLLSGLGFSDAAARQPVDAFSGGWRMRIALAQTLMCRSDLLLLDEPTNHLDLPAILWLERWLKGYTGMLILISHDRDFMDGVCTHIAHIERQSLRLYPGNYSEFERQRGERLARQQAMYDKQQREIAHVQRFIDRFKAQANKASQARSRQRMLERMTRIAPAHADSPFRFEFLEPQRLPQYLLQLEDVSAGYSAPVLTDVSVNITAGNRIGLLGVNGAGKSTLVKALASGETVLDGTRTQHRDAVIGYFAQHQLELLDPSASPMDHLDRQSPGLSEQQARDFLGGFAFHGDRVFEPVEPFSGGEKARLVLALIIQQRPNLLLLDEPTNHLDLEMRHALTLALQDYAGALVVIAHDRHLLKSVCDELLLVHDGHCDVFKHDLDHYARWVAGAIESNNETDSARQPTDRKTQKRREAERRQRLKPFNDRVRDLEQRIARARKNLKAVEDQLADPELYESTERKQELQGLLFDQGRLKGQLQELEDECLQAMEELEQAEQRK